MSTATIPQLSAQTRDKLGTRYTRRLRAQAQIPAVIYGHQQQPLHVSVDAREFNELMQHHAHLIEVSLGNQTEPCLIKDVQWDFMSAKIIHVDLARVDLTETVEVEVELKFVGEPVGAKTTGAVLEHPLSSLEIACLATQIPELITVDVSNLQAGEAITVADLKLPEGVKALTDADAVVAQINLVEEEDLTTPVAADAAAEPELIGRPAKEDEAAAEDKK